MYFFMRICLILLALLALAGCDEQSAPVDVAIVHQIPAGSEYAAPDQFLLTLLEQGGLPAGSRVAFYHGNGDKEWDGDYKNRTKAVSSYQSIAKQSGRSGIAVKDAADHARRWLMTRPPTTPYHRRLLILIVSEKGWDKSGAEGQEFSRLLRYDWDGAQEGLVEVIVVGVPEAHQPQVRKAWEGRLSLAPRLYDLEHQLTYDDIGLTKPKHD